MRQSPHRAPIALSAAVAALLFPLVARSETSCGDLLIVLDRSGSMAYCRIGGMTKEAIARAVLKDVTYKYAYVPMGLMVFPDTISTCPAIPSDGACAPGVVVIDLATDGADRIFKWIDGMPKSCGGTPTGRTMENARDYAKWMPGKEHYVLLVTDGGPTCDDGIEGGTGDGSGGAESCKADPPGTPCNGQGACQCKNPTKAYDAVKNLADRGIHTFVVGFEGLCYGQPPGTPPPYDPNILNKLADLGLEPQAGMPKYYPAMDKDSLGLALGKIIGKVSGATVGGCAKGGGGSGGGSGGGGSGGGGSGGGGGPPKDASGQESGGGDGGPGVGGRMQPGCACVLGSTSDDGGPTPPLLVLGLSVLVRGRRRT